MTTSVTCMVCILCYHGKLVTQQMFRYKQHLSYLCLSPFPFTATVAAAKANDQQNQHQKSSSSHHYCYGNDYCAIQHSCSEVDHYMLNTCSRYMVSAFSTN